jgi:hypothetical protein
MRLKHKVREIGAGTTSGLPTTTNRFAVREIRVTVRNISHGDTAYTAKNTCILLCAALAKTRISALRLCVSAREILRAYHSKGHGETRNLRMLSALVGSVADGFTGHLTIGIPG